MPIIPLQCHSCKTKWAWIGKLSSELLLLADRLHRVPDLTVGAMHHPQSHLADFYRELGDIFGISLKPSNR